MNRKQQQLVITCSTPQSKLMTISKCIKKTSNKTLKLQSNLNNLMSKTKLRRIPINKVKKAQK